jgi:hypothetical protein
MSPIDLSQINASQIDATLQRALVQVKPQTPAALHGWLRAVLGIHVPRHPRCSDHVTPMHYLEHVFFERPGDVLVWASRGGGKTFYGAVATLLDLLFKPGIEVRILGGSLEQSSKMYEHLRWMLEKPALREQVKGKITQRGVTLLNGSRVELLAQSERSVRGQRVQKLRCDEVELFDPDVWRAAHFVTRSAVLGGQQVRGAIEAASTMHRPFGLMQELVREAQQGGSWRLMQWCVLDVMQRCEMEQACESCSLLEACGSRARRWRHGFMAAADVLAQFERSSDEAFAAEMLCREPSRSDAVLPEFSPAVHVMELEADAGLMWVAGMDFGVRSPLVMLWGQTREVDGGTRLEVIDEYVATDRSLDEHLARIADRPWPRPTWIGVDPAGNARSLQTGRSDVAALKAAGYSVRTRPTRIRDGIEHLKRRLRPHDDAAQRLLVIHPRCTKLIESLRAYHYDPQNPQCDEPVKDGSDHAVDALRYLVMNLETGGPVKVVAY